MSVGLNATLTSYNDRMDFGFVGNGATMYDLPELARHVQEAYQELRSAASKKRPAKRSTTQPRKSRSAPARCR